MFLLRTWSRMVYFIAVAVVFGNGAEGASLSRSVLRAAEVDCSFGTILLHGAFIDPDDLLVTLDDGRSRPPVELALVGAATPSMLTVALPNGCEPPGTYRLELGIRNAAPLRARPLQTFSTLDVTLGNLGPEGPPGPPGAPAPPDLELLQRLLALETRVEELEIELGVCTPSQEICDGIDNDCDGEVDEGEACSDLPPPRSPLAGELVITEILANPAAVTDNRGEWFEIWNRASVPLDVNGCVIADAGSEKHRITDAPPLPPGAFVLFARNPDPSANGGVLPHYTYGGISLSNSGDDLRVSCAETVIDQVGYQESLRGVSSQLGAGFLDATLNDDPLRWCASSLPFGSGDLGSPAAENAPCPE